MKKLLILSLLIVSAFSCSNDDISEFENKDQININSETKHKDLYKSQNYNYTLNTLNPIFTGATFGVKSSSGDLQIATNTPYPYSITFLFKWYRITGGSRHQVIPVVYSMTLPANSTFVEEDMNYADYLLNQDCVSNETINAQYAVEIYDAFSIGEDYSFDNVTINNNNMNYSVEYRCGEWGTQF